GYVNLGLNFRNNGGRGSRCSRARGSPAESASADRRAPPPIPCSVDLGIIGYPRSGKTTVFNAVTRGHAATGAYGAGVQPNIGVVKVPDERLSRLAALFHPKKFTLADIRYVDFPGEG